MLEAGGWNLESAEYSTYVKVECQRQTKRSHDSQAGNCASQPCDRSLVQSPRVELCQDIACGILHTLIIIQN